MTAVDFSSFVEQLARVSGEAIMPFFRTSLGAENKAGAGAAFDPVTEADRAAEVAMRRLIAANFPDHGIVGEEFPDVAAHSDYVWVLDPIDGTKSFISGLPVWGTLIGLLHRGRPCFGVMHQPFTREIFVGNGSGTRWRGPGAVAERKLDVRACASLAEATLMTTSPLLIPPHQRDAFARVEAKVRLSRYGGDCYAYCMLAAGHVDLVIESGLNSYDIVALIPIIEGAGGIVTTWDGGDPAKGGAIIAAGDKRVHAEAMALLTG
jgi:myo-inositol-1(or 4)-monophosphatase